MPLITEYISLCGVGSWLGVHNCTLLYPLLCLSQVSFFPKGPWTLLALIPEQALKSPYQLILRISWLQWDKYFDLTPLIIFSHLPDLPILTVFLSLFFKKIILFSFETLADFWDENTLHIAIIFLLYKASSYLSLDLFLYDTSTMWKPKTICLWTVFLSLCYLYFFLLSFLLIPPIVQSHGLKL